MSTSSRYYSTEYKQQVVTYYIQHQSSTSFRAVAALFNVKGGPSTVYRWYNRRNSLQTKARSGRPSILSTREIDTHIKNKIIAKNRLHQAVHYTNLINNIKTATNKNVSLRTIQRIGKNTLNVKLKKTCKRTTDECIYTHTIYHNYCSYL